MHTTLNERTIQRFLENLRNRNIEIRAMTLYLNGEKEAGAILGTVSKK